MLVFPRLGLLNPEFFFYLNYRQTQRSPEMSQDMNTGDQQKPETKSSNRLVPTNASDADHRSHPLSMIQINLTNTDPGLQ